MRCIECYEGHIKDTFSAHWHCFCWSSARQGTGWIFNQLPFWLHHLFFFFAKLQVGIIFLQAQQNESWAGSMDFIQQCLSLFCKTALVRGQSIKVKIPFFLTLVHFSMAGRFKWLKKTKNGDEMELSVENQIKTLRFSFALQPSVCHKSELGVVWLLYSMLPEYIKETVIPPILHSLTREA